ncbi:PTS mannitol transporter subunit IICB [Catenisphaera adipataccumulans]|jgi:PTS system mannitol-specific IIC component|uniref:PTS system mannitol-specific EIICB component n=1 Tax=Catenisphaera adipataccumulans TaxID=700500 RepID=A0A7W8FWY7_9FIRM|nr:PTS mannitol transporter subunit IICB [Catenisphaera adipataccumulans]MBB5183791.1 PTS system mannitol-specific IIC component [Catenisphaera adipataccumulans]
MNNQSGNAETLRVRIQKMGGVLSNMVMPIIGAFIAWGLITALFLSTGWIPNEEFAKLIDPMKIYMLPMLIAFMGGYNQYGIRGGVIGAVGTMGAIIGTDIAMFMGAMVIGPTSAILLKKLDKVLEDKTPAGLEMLVNNFSAGILGLILALIAYVIAGPFFEAITNILTVGVEWIIDHNLIPLANVFIEPGKVLFLNNAINHGILSPIGMVEASKTGKSILFLLEPNPGPSLGMLIAFAIFGKGTAKASAPSVAIITSIGGIHEPYFPFVLMKPSMLLALIAGGVTGTSLFSLFNCGLVSTASPGSFFSILAVAPRSDWIPILIGIFASAGVSFVVASIILKLSKDTDEDESFEEAMNQKNTMKEAGSVLQLEGVGNGINSVNTTAAADAASYANFDGIIFACDAGMGSSAMGSSILKKKLKEAGIDVPVTHSAINNLTNDPKKLIVTQESLLDRAMSKTPDCVHETVDNFMSSPTYDEIVNKFKQAKKSS